MRIEKMARVVSHYGAAVISFVFEAFAFAALFGGWAFGALAIPLEAGKNYLLYYLKSGRKILILSWSVYILLTVVSVAATAYYSYYAMVVNDRQNDAQSLATVRQQYSTSIELLGSLAQETYSNTASLPSNWVATRGSAKDDIFEIIEMQAGLISNAQTMTNAAVAVSGIDRFEVIAGDAGMDVNRLIMVLMLIVGATLELLIYATEPWGDVSHEKPAAVETMAAYVNALFDAPTSRKGLPSDRAVSEYSGLPLEFCEACRKELKARGYLTTSPESRATIALMQRDEILKIIGGIKK